MDLARKIFDSSYKLFKPFLFYATRKDPEIAHDWFLLFSKFLMTTGLERFVLDNKTNYNKLPFEITNAAGLDKNAAVSPQFFMYLGFDGATYGTITGEKNFGESRPRTKRIEKSSMLNDIRWENDGAEIVSTRVKSYKNYEIPIIIGIGYTPIPEWNFEQRLEDLKKTIKSFENVNCIGGVEYNPSCGNLLISREENQEFSEEATHFIKSLLSPWQELILKVSPDMNQKEIEKFIKVTYDFVDGYVTTNTTKRHNYGWGSASGNMLYDLAFETQKIFYEILKGTDKKIIACGGINSVGRALERIEFEPQEDKRIQILTGLFYEGPRLLRKLRELKF